MNRLESAYSQENPEDRQRQAMVKSIIARIEESATPLHEDRELLQRISKLGLLRDMPEEFYTAAQDILGFVFSIEKDLTTAKDSHHG